MFFIITKLYWYISGLKQIMWNYSESGHGKGAADGIGGTVKRTADAAVAQGKDIASLDSFIKQITSNTQNIVVKVVDEYQIYEKDLLIPKTELLALKGTLNVHQVLWHKGKEEFGFREASCLVCVNCHCPHTKMVGTLQYRNIENKENDRPHTERPKVIIQSNILLYPARVSKTEVTRLCDIKPDNNLHLYPDLDINEMVRKYNISNATANFSGCFEDFIKTSCSMSKVCQNVSQELEPSNLEDHTLARPGGSLYEEQ